jgi:hypothetical protein
MQGSVLSSKQFNIYLDHALKEDPVLKEAVSRGDLKAFADDILASNNGALSSIILALNNMKESHGLCLNKEKTVIMTDLKEMDKVEKIEGIKKVTEAKFLGIQVVLNRQKLVERAKERI